ncbi:exodeoxyribonuclease VII small subunit [Rubritalea marina]|uniref:exodeoxyribonuclease VII small subunit n=1 Tax=Rubritalea marina TaxID=361055 RepID=UPI0003A13787|nr:exodeoxyribonuclease VII small subunit [Rubritalea marina]
MAKKAAKPFESSLAELDQLVEQMESDQLPLEELISHYERGAELIKQCESTLKAAKMRLETIQNTGSNSPAANEQQPSTQSTLASQDDDEIRLF